MSLDGTLPEAKTICLFRPQLTPAGRSEKLFQPRDQFRPQNGFSAQKEPMGDASMVVVLRQPNSREESKSIKNGDVAEDWNDNQKGQKDTDAGWMKKNELNHLGNQNQIEIDVKHKLIGRDEVRPAWVYDRHV